MLSTIRSEASRREDEDHRSYFSDEDSRPCFPDMTVENTQEATPADLGPSLDGVDVRDRTTKEGKGDLVFVVHFAGNDDPHNPHNWSFAKRATCTVLVAMVCFACMVSSSIESAVAPQIAEEFGVSLVVESLATGKISVTTETERSNTDTAIAQFLLGSAAGCLFTGPFSETFGRSPVYIGSMVLFMIWVLASGLSPNIGAQVTFRFFVGIFGCSPLTCAGGTIADLWNPLEKVYGFPMFAILGFGGAMLGPVIGSYVYTYHWRWVDWITLIMAGLVTLLVLFLLPETHPGIIQSWRAKQLRKTTGDNRYRSQAEIIQIGFWVRMERAVLRPWALATDAIVVAITFYLTIIWAILFTFLDGYTYIFAETYGVSQGITGVIFTAMYVGVLLSTFLVPVVYRLTTRDMERQRSRKDEQIESEAAKSQPQKAMRPRPETRLYYAMLGGGWAIPVSIFWLAWTAYPSVKIWSPIVATTLFGFGLINVFLSSYMFIIDAYEVNAASALTFATFFRYLVSGGLTVAGIPFYENVGVHWTLTIMGCLSLICAPIPYLLYRYGKWIRVHSKHCVNKE